ncbi:hypothetical protein V5O48_012268 [Marasmius crinis-equi]|uniref:BZIP domain-containing protein n=1 Tax=Marasmius crinis-equi TaxID=585013 RepID=A0ABR3F392_9AGAR
MSSSSPKPPKPQRKWLLQLYADYQAENPDGHPLDHPLLHSFVFPPDLPPSDPPSPSSNSLDNDDDQALPPTFPSSNSPPPVTDFVEDNEPQVDSDNDDLFTDNERQLTHNLDSLEYNEPQAIQDFDNLFQDSDDLPEDNKLQPDGDSVGVHSIANAPGDLTASSASEQPQLGRGGEPDAGISAFHLAHVHRDGLGEYDAGDHLKNLINCPLVAVGPASSADRKDTGPRPPKYRKGPKTSQKQTDEQLALKRERQRQNSRKYYVQHRVQIKERLRDRKERCEREPDKDEVTQAELDEIRRAKQREYSRRYRERNKEFVNIRERVRRREREFERTVARAEI